MQKLNDTVFDALATRGYAIVHNFLPESQRAEMAAALRRILKPWDEAKGNLPAKFSANCHFPYQEQCLNRAILNREAIAFSRRWLDTDQIHYRPGLGLVTYPGRKNMSFHIDNGNNSLPPPTESDRSYSQLNFWFCLEDVDPDQGPTLLSADADGQHQDPTRAEAMIAPGGSVAIFHNYSWHSGSDFLREESQRYIWKFAFGRVDHYWEGATPTSCKIPISVSLSVALMPPIDSSSDFPRPVTPTTPARHWPLLKSSIPAGTPAANISLKTAELKRIN